MIDFECPNCGQELAAEYSDRGNVFPCPQCGENVRVPNAVKLKKRTQVKIRSASSTPSVHSMRTDRLLGFELTSAPPTYIPAFRKIADRFAAGSINEATAVDDILIWLKKHGINPNPHGDIDDWTSLKHIHSILNDYFNMKAGLRDYLENQNHAVADMFPARCLIVWSEVEEDSQRDWAERWKAACEHVHWAGCSRTEAMAYINSPVWEALGNGAGGFEDWLGNPFPPFAFSSGIGWENVEREEAEQCGVPLPKEPVHRGPIPKDVARALRILGGMK